MSLSQSERQRVTCCEPRFITSPGDPWPDDGSMRRTAITAHPRLLCKNALADSLQRKRSNLSR